MRVALKIDVHSLAGATQGVPALLRLLDTYRVRASFCIATGRADGWLGRLIPGPGIERRAAAELRAIRAAGHELGIAFDNAPQWRRKVAQADAVWTRANATASVARFERLLGERPTFGAAPDWQINPHLLTIQDEWGWQWASDTRGRYPFLPVLQGVRSDCIQIPTTLPTMDELLVSRRAAPDDVHEYLYTESRHVRPAGHVYTANAGREGIRFLRTMEKLIVMWKGQERALRPLGEIVRELVVERIPLHQIGWTQVPGRETHVAAQSVQVPK